MKTLQVHRRWVGALSSAIARGAGIELFLPTSRNKLRMAIDTSPKSMSTDRVDAFVAHRAVIRHIGQFVKCLSETPRRVCSS